MPRKNPTAELFIGQRFGHLVVIGIGQSGKNRTRFICQCDCGQQTLTLRSNLSSVNSSPCRHRTGRSKDALYQTWRSMINRCNDPKNADYYLYGARGIQVCERWINSFEDFRSDIGPKPTPTHTLDRINNDGNYQPNNCRWATVKEQNNHKRDNVIITFRDKSQTLKMWAEETGIHRATLTTRINSSWPIEKALTTPVRRIRLRKASRLVVN